jgi:hypothetical protein
MTYTSIYFEAVESKLVPKEHECKIEAYNIEQ